MNCTELLHKVKVSSCCGKIECYRTGRPMVLLCQGVVRKGLMLPVSTRLTLRVAVTLPVIGQPMGLHSVASISYRYKNCYFHDCFQAKLSGVQVRRLNQQFDTKNCDLDHQFLSNIPQIRKNIQNQRASFALKKNFHGSTGSFLNEGESRLWTNLNRHTCKPNSNLEARPNSCMITQHVKKFYHSHSEGPGWEVHPSTFSSTEKTRKFVKKLRSKQRAVLMNELQILDKELHKETVVEDQTMLLPPSRKQLHLVLLNNAVPFIGFGFLDNAIMIAAGDYIDWKIGAALHISTMAAAGLGNLVSDLAGVVLAGYVETFAARLGIPTPNLSLEQYEMSQSKLASSIGRCFGIAIGCLLGMFPLLFLNTDRDEETEEPDVKGN